MTDALMQNVDAVHICNWDEYVSSLRAMLPWMVAYDNNRYGRWLPNFWAMLTALPDDQVAFLRTDFTQSITGNPYSNIAWDMWIECTMNNRRPTEAREHTIHMVRLCPQANIYHPCPPWSC